MTIHERMVPRSEREKDLLKYGRSQERDRIIKLLQDTYANNDNNQYSAGLDLAVSVMEEANHEPV